MGSVERESIDASGVKYRRNVLEEKKRKEKKKGKEGGKQTVLQNGKRFAWRDCNPLQTTSLLRFELALLRLTCQQTGWAPASGLLLNQVCWVGSERALFGFMGAMEGGRFVLGSPHKQRDKER